MTLATERLLLRRFRRDDLDSFVAYRRDPEVARYQSWDSSYSMAEAEKFLAEQEHMEPGDVGWQQLAIEERSSGTLCGDCAVHIVEDQPRTAELGVTLASSFQGKGIATEALRAVIDWLFVSLDFHRVFAHADDRNERVHRLLEGLGFRLEGRFVEADWFKGQWTTLRLYALLQGELQQSHPR